MVNPVKFAFLDKLVEESETYAKGLGDRLKERVFEQIFPHFAKGFIEYLKQDSRVLQSLIRKRCFPLYSSCPLEQEPNEEFRRSGI